MESIHSFQLKKLVNIQEAFEGLLQCITLHLKILLFSGSRKKKAKSSHQNATCDPVQTVCLQKYRLQSVFIILLQYGWDDPHRT